jgi:hypothetical protein
MNRAWDNSVQNFAHFAATFEPAETGSAGTCLEPLLAGWLAVGDGIDYTAANYDHFLQTTLHIIDAITSGILSLDYRGPDLPPRPRCLSGLTDPSPNSDNVLTRLGFDRMIYETLKLRRVERLREETA